MSNFNILTIFVLLFIQFYTFLLYSINTITPFSSLSILFRSIFFFTTISFFITQKQKWYARINELKTNTKT